MLAKFKFQRKGENDLNVLNPQHYFEAYICEVCNRAQTPLPFQSFIQNFHLNRMLNISVIISTTGSGWQKGSSENCFNKTYQRSFETMKLKERKSLDENWMKKTTKKY